MRAQVKELLSENTGFDIEIICNCMEPIYVQRQQPTKKYKKVGKEARAKLIRCIQNGWSIINVARKFTINYSTAKSIVQNYKKKGSEKNDAKISDTDSCESIAVALE